MRSERPEGLTKPRSACLYFRPACLLLVFPEIESVCSGTGQCGVVIATELLYACRADAARRL